MRTYAVRMTKTVDVIVTVEVEEIWLDLDLENDADRQRIKDIAGDIFVETVSSGPVWLKDAWTENVEFIKEV